MKKTITRFHGTHPFLWVYENFSKLDIAAAVGHKNHSTLAIYATRCRKDRHHMVPAAWVIPLCRFVGGELQPHNLRPDLYYKQWRWDDKSKRLKA